MFPGKMEPSGNNFALKGVFLFFSFFLLSKFDIMRTATLYDSGNIFWISHDGLPPSTN